MQWRLGFYLCLLASGVSVAAAQEAITTPAPNQAPGKYGWPEGYSEKDLPKLDDSFVLENPRENQFLPISAACEKQLTPIYTECGKSPPTRKCDQMVEAFQKNCAIHPPEEKDKGKEKETYERLPPEIPLMYQKQ